MVLYHGNCHCGRYRFELEVPSITKGIECSCRQCTKKGYRWLSPPEDAFRVTRGGDDLAEFDSGVLKDQVNKRAT